MNACRYPIPEFDLETDLEVPVHLLVVKFLRVGDLFEAFKVYASF